MAVQTYSVVLDATTAVRILPSPDGTVVPRGTSDNPTQIYFFVSGEQTYIGGADLADSGSNGFPLTPIGSRVFYARAGDEIYATRAAGASATRMRVVVSE